MGRKPEGVAGRLSGISPSALSAATGASDADADSEPMADPSEGAIVGASRLGPVGKPVGENLVAISVCTKVPSGLESPCDCED